MLGFEILSESKEMTSFETNTVNRYLRMERVVAQ